PRFAAAKCSRPGCTRQREWQKKSPRERGLFQLYGAIRMPPAELLLDQPPDQNADQNEQDQGRAIRAGRQALDLARKRGDFGIGQCGDAVLGSLRREAERLKLAGDVGPADLTADERARGLRLRR